MFSRKDLATQLIVMAATVFGATFNAVAGENNASFSEENFDTLPIVIGSSRIKDKKQLSSHGLSVIGRDMIDRLGARTIADAIRLIPGFTVGYRYGNQPTIINRGLVSEQNKRIEIQIDGFSVYLPATGGTFLQSLPVQLYDVERIEVQHGPSSAWNGSNALLATINIITRHSLSADRFSASAAIGSNGIRDYSLHGSTKVNDSWSFSVSAHDQNDDGLELRSDTRSDKSLLMRHDINIDIDQSLMLGLGISEGSYEAGGTDQNLDPLRDLSQKRWLAYLSHYYTFSNTHDMVTKLYFNKFEQNHVKNAIHPLMGRFSVDYGYSTSRSYIEHYHTYNWSYFNAAIGLAYSNEEYESISRINEDVGHKVENDKLRAFIQSEYNWSHSNISHLGIMAENVNDEDNTVSAHLSHVYTPSPDHSIRVGYSFGSRVPSGYENTGTSKIDVDALPFPLYTHYSTGYQNGGLDNEEIKEVYLSYDFINKDQGMTGGLRGYYDEIDNYIDYFERFDATQPLMPIVADIGNSDGTVYLKGVESYLKWTSSDYKLNIYGTLAYSKLSGENPSGFSLVESYPEIISTIMVGYDFTPQFSIGGTWHYVSDASYWQGVEKDTSRKLDLNAKYCSKYYDNSQFCANFAVQNAIGEVADARNNYYWDPAYYVNISYTFY